MARFEGMMSLPSVEKLGLSKKKDKEAPLSSLTEAHFAFFTYIMHFISIFPPPVCNNVSHPLSCFIYATILSDSRNPPSNGF